MRKINDFAWHLTSFLSKYLPGERNMSTNTIAAYRDAFHLFLVFCEEEKGISPDKITISLLKKETILDYLDWLEKKRKCSITTRNQRLSSIHGFFKYVQKESPEDLFEIRRILGISCDFSHYSADVAS